MKVFRKWWDRMFGNAVTYPRQREFTLGGPVSDVEHPLEGPIEPGSIRTARIQGIDKSTYDSRAQGGDPMNYETPVIRNKDWAERSILAPKIQFDSRAIRHLFEPHADDASKCSRCPHPRTDSVHDVFLTDKLTAPKSDKLTSDKLVADMLRPSFPDGAREPIVGDLRVDDDCVFIWTGARWVFCPRTSIAELVQEVSDGLHPYSTFNLGYDGTRWAAKADGWTVDAVYREAETPGEAVQRLIWAMRIEKRKNPGA